MKRVGRLNKVILLATLLSLAFSLNIFADTIKLKNGQTLDGNITQRDKDSIKINLFDVEVTYFMDDIDSINGESVKLEEMAPVLDTDIQVPVTDDQSSPAKDTPETSTHFIQVEKEDMKTKEGQSAEKLSISYGSTGSKSDKNAVSLPAVNMSAGKNTAAKTLSVIAIIIVVLGLILYIYTSLCLYIIANKTGTDYAFLAWIPIANLFLMCKIGSLSYWWLLCCLLAFVPIVGTLATLGITGYMWYKIALARNKEGFWGILCAIPLVGIFIMGYLAFSD